MDIVASRCLLCLVKVESETESPFENVTESSSLLQCHFEIEKGEQLNRNEAECVISNNTTTSNLQRQLDVIFLLKNVLQLPLTHLKRFLKVRGDPAGWISLCGSCILLVKNVKEIFLQLRKISKKYDEARIKVEERIRTTSMMNAVKTGNDFILEESRKTVCKRKKEAVEQINFLEGDSKAQLLLQVHRNKQVAEEGQVSEELETSSFPLEIEREDVESLQNPDAFDDQLDSKDGTLHQLSNTKNMSLRKRKQASSKPSSKPEVIGKRRKKGSRSIVTLKRNKKSTPRIKLDEAELRKRITCQFCQKVITLKNSMRRHLFRVHNFYEGTPPKTFLCSVKGCKKLFHHKKSYLVHMKWHKMGVKPSCTICKTDFTSQKILDQHDLLVHKIVKSSTQSKKFYECQKCGQCSISELHLNSHSLACRGKKAQGPLECDLCQTKCATSKDLRIYKKFKHSIVAKESKEEMEEPEPNPDPDNDFPCPQCGKICRGEFALDGHVKTVHPTDEPKHICIICPDKKYHVKTDLNRHLARHHNIGTENYKCSLCGTFCKTKAQRKKHVCGVADNPSSACDICGKEFSRK